MDNKAQVQITGAIIFLAVAVIITIILGLGFLFSNSFKFYIIGGTIILIALIYGFKSPDMNKQKSFVMILAILIGAGFILIPALGLIQTGYSATFTPVYCNDYSFTCCVEKLQSTLSGTIPLLVTKSWQCPATASKCTITSATNSFYVGHNNCAYKFGWRYLGGYYFYCDDDIKYNAPKDIAPGDYVSSSLNLAGGTNVQINVYQNKLIFTGRAGSTEGVEVAGSDGCSFNPTSTYKDGKLVTFDPKATSYPTKPGSCIMTFVPGDRHICGNLEEQCKIDSDCTGHTYGTKECIGRTLQTYGCTRLQTPSFLETYSNGYAYKAFQGDNDGSESQLSRCEIKSATQVQCCGDTDCGSNAFCDKTTFTCKAQNVVECTQNSQCGVSQQCDFNLKQLKTPVCTSNKCVFTSVPIECCSSSDCGSDYYCSNNKCLQSTVPKVNCPSECCISDTRYFDKPCNSGSFCVNNLCKTAGCTLDNECDVNEQCKDGNCIPKNESVPPKCSWYQEYLTKSSNKYAWYDFLKLNPQTTTTSGCATSNAIVITIVAIVGIGAIVGLVIYYNPRKLIRRKKK